MKKVYEAPKIFRIRLNHEQAILSVCATNTTLTAETGTTGCRNGNPRCRKSSLAGNSAMSS